MFWDGMVYGILGLFCLMLQNGGIIMMQTGAISYNWFARVFYMLFGIALVLVAILGWIIVIVKCFSYL